MEKDLFLSNLKQEQITIKRTGRNLRPVPKALTIR